MMWLRATIAAVSLAMAGGGQALAQGVAGKPGASMACSVGDSAGDRAEVVFDNKGRLLRFSFSWEKGDSSCGVFLQRGGERGYEYLQRWEDKGGRTVVVEESEDNGRLTEIARFVFSGSGDALDVAIDIAGPHYVHCRPDISLPARVAFRKGRTGCEVAKGR